MKEPYGEDLASHANPESCTDGREVAGEAWTGACAGPVLSLEKFFDRGADAVSKSGRQHLSGRLGETRWDPAWSETWSMHRNTSRENREISVLPTVDGSVGRAGKSKDVIQR